MNNERALAAYRTSSLISAAMCGVGFFLPFYELEPVRLSGLNCVKALFGVGEVGEWRQLLFGFLSEADRFSLSWKLALPLGMALDSLRGVYRWARSSKPDYTLSPATRVDVVFLAVLVVLVLLGIRNMSGSLGVGAWLWIGSSLLTTVVAYANRRLLEEIAEDDGSMGGDSAELSFSETFWDQAAKETVSSQASVRAQVFNVNGSLECSNCRKPVFPGEGLCSHCGAELTWEGRR
jgi:hypothetical protein